MSIASEEAKQLQLFHSAIVGWTIVAVKPCRVPESIFTLELVKDGKTKSVDIFATDLGWWSRLTGIHMPMKIGSGPDAADFCVICESTDLSKPCI